MKRIIRDGAIPQSCFHDPGSGYQNTPGQWQTVYGYRPVLLESFVEKDRFHGTCYKAANWLYLGQTQGRGKLGPAGKGAFPSKTYLISKMLQLM